MQRHVGEQEKPKGIKIVVVVGVRHQREFVKNSETGK